MPTRGGSRCHRIQVVRAGLAWAAYLPGTGSSRGHRPSRNLAFRRLEWAPLGAPFFCGHRPSPDPQRTGKGSRVPADVEGPPHEQMVNCPRSQPCGPRHPWTAAAASCPRRPGSFITNACAPPSPWLPHLPSAPAPGHTSCVRTAHVRALEGQRPLISEFYKSSISFHGDALCYGQRTH